jgi:hypothetical protein
VRPIPIALTLLVLTAACETSTDPTLIGIGGGVGGPVTQAEATGDWSFTINKTTTFPCTGGSLADGTVLTAHIDLASDGRLNASGSFWRNPPTAFVFPLSGSVSLSTGASDLFLSGGGGGASAMELIGNMTSTGSFSGTLHDPAAGFSPVFSAGGCDYATNGTKA